MRTLGDIVEATMAGERPEYDELRYALLAYQALSTFDRLALMKLAEAERDGKRPILTRSAVFQWEEMFKRSKRALEKSPKDWLGWDHDPENPEYLKRRATAKKVYAHVMQQTEK